MLFFSQQCQQKPEQNLIEKSQKLEIELQFYIEKVKFRIWNKILQTKKKSIRGQTEFTVELSKEFNLPYSKNAKWMLKKHVKIFWYSKVKFPLWKSTHAKKKGRCFKKKFKFEKNLEKISRSFKKFSALPKFGSVRNYFNQNFKHKKSFSPKESHPKKPKKFTVKPNPNRIPNPNRLFQYLDSHSKYQKSFKTKIRQL